MTKVTVIPGAPLPPPPDTIRLELDRDLAELVYFLVNNVVVVGAPHVLLCEALRLAGISNSAYKWRFAGMARSPVIRA